MKSRLKIAIVLGSTRPGRRVEAVSSWVHQQAVRRGDADYELVDLADHDLPLLDEPQPAIFGEYLRPHTKAWAQRVDAFDAFVFVTPEYNRSIPAALKNAIDYLYAEWGNKAAGIVSYGVDAGGARAGEHLRQILAEVHIAGVRSTVTLSRFSDFHSDHGFVPAPHRAAELDRMLDEVISWAGALRPLRLTATVS